MANIFNLNGNDDVMIFNLGDLRLEFQPTDEKSKELSDKALELKEKADNVTEGDEWENRRTIKELLDDFFGVMFDTDVTEKIYDAAGKNTWSYLKIFLQIADAVIDVKRKQENDETFKKYLAE
ncbi:hypothetical protein [Streptococcus himalayensis]|uniref:Phage protein n=1 Tax=Streptococcus himalayensis TaxID=1888195 RepID=A0A917A4Z0_9STRE|nr:hypothetical protein [Streptococcus himalayensis]QBX25366.1 hypothetical protein Javan254_0011 [Streptococcus phage Javan254]GGE26273.1 hypothetical protein GCM10011510_04300 [Streptococcus himalayensis]